MAALSKKHLLLTGSRGAGKSTVLRELFAPGVPALTTFARPGEGVWLEGGGITAQVGRYALDTPGIPGGMVPLPGAFETAGVSALEALTGSPGEWAVLDEVGYLEGDSAPYLAALEALLEKKRVAAAIRKGDLPHLKALLARPDALVIDLDAPFPALGWVVMASGLGSRYGGNKLLAPLGGRAVLAHVLETGRELFPHSVVVTRSPDTAALARSLGVAALVHDRPFRSDTVKLGLEALGDCPAGVVFSPGDQPLISRETLETLALCAGAAPNHIWRTCDGGRPGAPLYFPAPFRPALLALSGKAGGGAVAKENPGQVGWVPVREEWELWDLDRPEDLPRLEEVLARSPS